jgi:hypothetical protein
MKSTKEETEHRHESKEGFVMISHKKIAAPGAKKRGRKTRQQGKRDRYSLHVTTF